MQGIWMRCYCYIVCVAYMRTSVCCVHDARAYTHAHAHIALLVYSRFAHSKVELNCFRNDDGSSIDSIFFSFSSLTFLVSSCSYQRNKNEGTEKKTWNCDKNWSNRMMTISIAYTFRFACEFWGAIHMQLVLGRDMLLNWKRWCW